MPLYEYQCRACGHRFERIRKFSDPPLNECPECGGEVEKLISAPAIQFKGEGWYITDYARKKESGKSDSSSSGDSSASSSSDSEKSGKSDKSDKSESTTKSDSSKDSTSKPASAGSKKND